MKNRNKAVGIQGVDFTVLILLVVLGVLFWRSFLPDFVHFSNDGPLGPQNAHFYHLPEAMTGMWDDLNDTGASIGSFAPSVTMVLKWLLNPLGYSKFVIPIGLLILGTGAWAFFRALKLTPLAALLGALAMMLNSTFFADTCWGLAPHAVAFGFSFFALALVAANADETPWLVRWSRLALAGLCVGINVIEAADIGALSSILVAAFVFWQAWTKSERPAWRGILTGVGRVTVIALFAGFIAFQAIIGLIGTSVQGVAGTAQDTETKAQHWDWATQWSLPKKETLGVVVPGLFGYKMDTPNNMMPQFQDAYRGGVYWGGIGRDPGLDRFLDAGGQGTPPSGFMRFTGGGYYAGILVLLVAAWGFAQSCRRNQTYFSDAQKKLIWFWAVVVAVCLPLGWGRFAPGSHGSDGVLFYALLYKLPYFSTIRNPIKFLYFFSWALVVLFAYGVHALSSRQLAGNAVKPLGAFDQFKTWWAKAASFDRKWMQVCGALIGASLIGWLVYSGQKTALVQYLQKMGYPDESLAQEIAAFSIAQAGWFVLLLAGALVLLALTLAGYFSGVRAKTGTLLLAGFLLFDLVRADLPYVIHWDYKQKYEVGSLNPVVDFLAQKPYEHRVAGLPFHAPQGLELLDQVYRIEWMQHHFPYYNIQCLDWIQMSRVPADLKMYLEALSPRGTAESVRLFARRWELSNTSYLLGAAGFLEVLNQQLDPVQRRFRIVQRFEIGPKPGIVQPQRLEELTAYVKSDGNYALIEFTGALPRAKLYANWQVNTNDEANLKTLADLNFDPAKTVLISTPQKNLAALATNENSGSVEFKSYAPTKIVFTANAAAPSVLLLNDKYDPNWRVTVDGKPAELLRCNFLMRGVQIPPGAHEVVFKFTLPNKPLYVTLSAMAVGLLLGAFLFFTRNRQNEPAARQITSRSGDPKSSTAT
jgi:Bacterial membrane protein YfhO